MLNAREIAVNILHEVLNEDAYSNITINKYLTDKLNSKDENLIREIVYGVLENDIYLEYILAKASNIKLKKIHSRVLIILKIGIYQMLFMDRIPDSASVNESVNIVKKMGNKGSVGFVNGILRNISRNKEEFKAINEKDKATYLCVKYSTPKWLINRWIKEFGYEFTEELCIKNNEKPELNIRVNTLKVSKSELIDQLKKYDYIIRESKYSRDTLIIENPIRITNTKEFKMGYFTIQDESSSLVAQIMNPEEGSIVIDVCSAPGGKSTHIAQLMNNKGKIISQDIHEHKIKLIKDNAKRLGINIIETGLSDATYRNERLVNTADYLLIDAPCSGFGLIRRKPEIKRNRKEEDIQVLVDIQRKILNNVKDYLKPGGILIYSTCTIEKEENNNMISKFLQENQEFTMVNIEDRIENHQDIKTLSEGYIQLYPNVQGTDGFYIAKMRKQG